MGTCTSQASSKHDYHSTQMDSFRKVQKKLSTTTIDSEALIHNEFTKKESGEISLSELDPHLEERDSSYIFNTQELEVSSRAKTPSVSLLKTSDVRHPESPTFGSLKTTIKLPSSPLTMSQSSNAISKRSKPLPTTGGKTRPSHSGRRQGITLSFDISMSLDAKYEE